MTGADIAHPSAGRTALPLHINMEALTWRNVELPNSNVFTLVSEKLLVIASRAFDSMYNWNSGTSVRQHTYE